MTTLRKKGHVNVAVSSESAPVNLYYELHGDGPEKILFVQGLSTPCFAWDIQVKYFAETGRYSVIMFDNRGMGLSDSPLGLYSTSLMANDALELLNHFGWTSDVHLVGVSMGGMISLEMVYAEPARFRSLTLTSTTARRNIPQWKAITSISKTIFLRTEAEKANEIVNLVFPESWLNAPSHRPQFKTNRAMILAGVLEHGKRSRMQPFHGHIGQIYGCLTHNVSNERLLAIKRHGIPILIVTGSLDYLIRPSSSIHMQKILGARLEYFDGSGHGLPVEQAERYNHLLDEHFTNATKT